MNLTGNVIRLQVLGDPKAQKRHRHVVRGRFARTFDPSEIEKRDLLLTVQQYAPVKPFDGPLKVTFEFFFTRPKSHYNKHGVKPNAPTWHTTTPDTDNTMKFVMDALTGIYWRDDSQVCLVSAMKRYSETPMTIVEIEAL
jgi:Holliday junction resolvase RusA-like endonuclease